MLRFLLPAVAMVAAILILLAGSLGGFSPVYREFQPARKPTSLPPQVQVAVQPVPPPASESTAVSAKPLDLPKEEPREAASAPASSTPPMQQMEMQAAQALPVSSHPALTDHPATDVIPSMPSLLPMDTAAARTQQPTELHPSAPVPPTPRTEQETGQAEIQAALDRLKTQQRSGDFGSAASPVSHHALAAPRPSVTFGTSLAVASPPPQPQESPAVAEPSQPDVSVSNLTTARQALVSGDLQSARRLLGLAETQMVFQPVSPDHPAASGGNLAATQIEDAVHSLDAGNPRLAMQYVDVALHAAEPDQASETATVTASGYTSEPLPAPR